MIILGVMGNKRTFFCIVMVAAYLMMMANSIVISKGSPLVLGFSIFVFGYLAFLNVKSEYCMKFFFMYLYLLFILTLIITTSSNQYFSFRLFAKYGMGILAFPAGFYLFDKVDDFKPMEKLSIIFMVLFLLNMILSNVLHLGGSRYGEDTVETGNLFDEALYCNVCIAIMMPLFFHLQKKQPLWITILLIVCVAFSCVLMKRTVIACFVVIYLLYYILKFYFINKYGKVEMDVVPVSWVRQVIIFLLLISAVFTFKGLFMKMFMVRENAMERGLDKEQRTQELFEIFDDIVVNPESPKTFLLGQETFNTVGTYAHGSFGKRMIHENLGIMLNGTGVVGFLFYLILDAYWLIVLFANISWERLKYSRQDRLLIYTYIALWAVYNISGMSGNIWVTIYPTFSFAVMGGIYRYFYSTKGLTYEDTVNSEL